MLILTETWLQDESKCTIVYDLLPEWYSLIHQSRAGKRGGGGRGGIAIVHNNSLSDNKLHTPITPTTFEVLECSVDSSPKPIHLICLYRSPSTSKSLFLDELDDLVSARYIQSSNLVLLGDVNIHMEDLSNTSTNRLHEILTALQLEQLLHHPTHGRGHTVDIVMSGPSSQISSLTVHSITISDHALVTFNMVMESVSATSNLSQPENAKNQSY